MSQVPEPSRSSASVDAFDDHQPTFVSERLEDASIVFFFTTAAKQLNKETKGEERKKRLAIRKRRAAMTRRFLVAEHGHAPTTNVRVFGSSRSCG